MFIFEYVLGFPSWFIPMRGETSGRGTQIDLVKSHIFNDKITPLTTSVYIKYRSGFKLI